MIIYEIYFDYYFVSPATADLTMDVTEEEYIPRVSPDIPGIQVFLRTSSDHSPLSPGQGVYVAAGETLQLSLRKVELADFFSVLVNCVAELNSSKQQHRLQLFG